MSFSLYDEDSVLQLTEELGIGDWYLRNFINTVVSDDEPVCDDAVTPDSPSVAA